MKYSALKTASLLLLLISVSGCATIMGDSTQTVPISSTPSDASLVITDEKGVEIFKGTTPTSITLAKSDGSYWGKKSYTVKILKAGFDTQTIFITPSANGYYIGGNILFGGLIGWFIVDPNNGKMYNLSPANITATLSAKVAQGNTVTNGGLAIMLIEDVPAELRSKMKLIN